LNSYLFLISFIDTCKVWTELPSYSYSSHLLELSSFNVLLCCEIHGVGCIVCVYQMSVLPQGTSKWGSSLTECLLIKQLHNIFVLRRNFVACNYWIRWCNLKLNYSGNILVN
jgi:hypothetical protein